MSSPSLFQRFVDRLTPRQEYAGLEIGEKSISYLLLSHYDLAVEKFAETPLAPGTIVKGELKNAGTFVEALGKLQQVIQCENGTCLPLIVSLPSSNFFLHVLELPDVPEASYEEAVRLNIGQVSPTPVADAYVDWQNLGVNLRTLQREFLIAVATKQRVDPFLEALRQVGLQPLALESRSLSLLRLFAYFSQTVEKNVTLMVIDVGQDGMTFLVGKQGKLFFDFYLFWIEVPEAQDGTITREDLEAILSREVRRVLEYYSMHNDEAVQNFTLFSPVLKQELGEYVAKNFGLRQIPVTLPNVAGEASGKPADIYAGLVGLGLRGSLIPRDADDIVSVLPENTRAIYLESRMASFASLWSKITLFTLGGVFAVSLVVFGLARREYLGAKASVDAFNRMPEAAKIAQLEDEAADFNALVARLSLAQKKTHTWTAYLDPIVGAAKATGVTVTRMSLSENSAQIRVWGAALNQERAFKFKSAVASSTAAFAGVDAPLSSFTQTQNGTEFMLVATVK